MPGRLDCCHFDFVYDSYIKGVSAWACAALMEGEGIFEKHPDPVEQSLGQLAEREQGVDVIISDFIRANMTRSRLFYSMNHPSRHVFRALTERLLEKVGLGAHIPRHDPPFELDGTVVGMFPALCRRYGFEETLRRWHDDAGVERHGEC
jgi:hypothetical protein